MLNSTGILYQVRKIKLKEVYLDGVDTKGELKYGEKQIRYSHVSNIRRNPKKIVQFKQTYNPGNTIESLTI